MKLQALCHMYVPMHNAGAEHMLHAMFTYLIGKGHSVEVVIGSSLGNPKPTFKDYEVDGVKVTCKTRNLGKCDIMFTHLDCTETAEKIADEKNVPLVQVFHNDQRPLMIKECALAVYNTDWIRRIGPSDLNSIVVHPPIWHERYKVENKGNAITLINLHVNKGVEMFYHLAKMFPQYRFLGVKGSYGQQIMPTEHIPNLEIWDNQTDIRKAYEQTHILLMPSSYESFGRCAVEAAVSGIPTIANPTKGLLEALSDAGTYPLPDSDSWAEAIKYVMGNYNLKSHQSMSIADQFDNTHEMEELEKALLKLHNSNFSDIMSELKNKREGVADASKDA